ncbi:MAG: hypothetical protein U9Q33_12610 [Campylobacterota bacterium]|nr:hypothetical protein [Campylobacterota bacterium]
MIRDIFVLLILSCFLEANSFEFEPYDNYTEGYRVVIGGKINDTLGIYDARVYFKDKKQKIYHLFSSMKCKGDICQGTIPIASKETKSFNYLVLYQNNGGEIYKTREFEIFKKDLIELPKWQNTDRSRLTLNTELAKIPRQLYGFDDKVRIKEVLPEQKIGCLSKISNCEMAGVKDQMAISGTFKGELGLLDKELDKSEKDENKSLLSSPYTIGAIILLLFIL